VNHDDSSNTLALQHVAHGGGRLRLSYVPLYYGAIGNLRLPSGFIHEPGVTLDNILAANAPTPFWLLSIRGNGVSPLSPLFSPVVLLSGNNNLWVGWSLLIGFYAVVVLMSANGHRSKTARLAIPAILFGYSLAQGLVFAAWITGIDAIGHS
jgi:hypothetical protein